MCIYLSRIKQKLYIAPHGGILIYDNALNSFS